MRCLDLLHNQWVPWTQTLMSGQLPLKRLGNMKSRAMIGMMHTMPRDIAGMMHMSPRFTQEADGILRIVVGRILICMMTHPLPQIVQSLALRTCHGKLPPLRPVLRARLCLRRASAQARGGIHAMAARRGCVTRAVSRSMDGGEVWTEI